MRVAGIDCGTNSIRLLIADVEPGTWAIRPLLRTMRIVRLGQGVDATGQLAPEAVDRTLAALRDYAADCRKLGVEAVRMVATSATRDATNAGQFIAAVEATLGVAPEVIDGLEEAALSFGGALTTVQAQPPVLVCDIGGGSTELVLGDSSRPDAVTAAYSMNIGCVRLTERYLLTDPPTPTELTTAMAEIDRQLELAAAAVDLSQARTLVGVAGSITSLTAYALGLDRYDPDRIDGTVLTIAQADAACRRIWSMTRSERLALGFLQPGRADVLGAGALVQSQVMAKIQAATRAGGHELATITTSEHDILDGIAISAAKQGMVPPR